ncbi:hypothetical protein BKA70DRAFT_1372228 [Coprinopsis sp. MPI-PUGE-AT-0042]|nr:hypothetical protein BKA70DRAFT_1372228 [Coprinopsis sp. MPI-PUGE-AT-0042]
MGRSKSLKVTRSPVVETNLVMVHSSCKSYVRIVRAKKGKPQPQSSPTPHPNKRPKPNNEEGPQDEGVSIDDDAPPFNLFQSNLSQPVIPNSNYDYMLQWAPKINPFLDTLYAHAALPTNPLCSKCGKGDAIWRCASCLASPLFCANCCRTEHEHRPFHRVEMWTGHCFEPSWLWKVGVCLHSGHGGRPCPSLPAHSFATPTPQEYQQNAKSTEANLNDVTFGSSPGEGSQGHIRELVVVHTNGVHQLQLHVCQCEDRKPEDIQVLEMGLYPSTFTSISTVFTFEVLDDFLLSTMECNTTAQQYYGKLRRKTNKDFPDSVKDRYRELLRVGRQYDFLRLLMRFLAFSLSEAQGDGSLALFCAACPQPGKNLPDDWWKDPDSWKYIMSFVGDGNFVCAHLKTKGAGQDVFLKQGQGYFVGPMEYNKYISKSKESYQESKCNVFRAIADKNRFHKGYDATGIGAIACARHGAMVPASVVDFQKGERQMNMDYSFCQTVKVVVDGRIKRVVYFYDISCFYCVNLDKRIKESEGRLALPELLEIIFGIGQFHVHGHQEACFGRFSPVFIEGIGWVSGEIVESNWSLINPIGLTCTTMTAAHRYEVLDAKILDLNWKKMSNLGVLSGQLWDPEEALELLGAATAPEMRSAWEAELRSAQEERLKGNVKAMDIMMARIKKAPSRKEVQGDLMAQETESKQGLGIAGWISGGIAIQEDQIALLSAISSNGRSLTDSQKVEIERRRQDLTRQFTKHAEDTATFFPGMEQATRFGRTVIREPCMCQDGDVCGHLDQDVDPFLALNSAAPLDAGAGALEVPLPSTAVIITEEALQGIRKEVGYKSFLFKAKRHLLHTKEMRTRGYKAVADADREIRRHVRLYNLARMALMRLSNDRVALSKYQPLFKADLKPLASIYAPNDAGSTTAAASWLWSVQLGLGSVHIRDVINHSPSQVSRVNYLRARCLRDRWAEELVLTKSEMRWTVTYFEWKAKEGPSKGRVACLQAQAAWKRLEARAESRFAEYTSIT